MKVSQIVVALNGEGGSKAFACGSFEIGGDKPNNLKNVCSGKPSFFWQGPKCRNFRSSNVSIFCHWWDKTPKLSKENDIFGLFFSLNLGVKQLSFYNSQITKTGFTVTSKRQKFWQSKILTFLYPITLKRVCHCQRSALLFVKLILHLSNVK